MAKKIQITLNFDEDLEVLLKKQFNNFSDYRILSKSLDGRGANRGKKPRYHYGIELIEKGEHFSKFSEKFCQIGAMKKRPIIIGSGPAGLFSALRFCEYGIPTTLIERGAPAGERMVDIAKFWRYGKLNPESNVCYGEGGAGLFSDGKLITRVKSPYIPYVMQKLVDFGAPDETAYLSNPHLGSNKIRNLITKLSTYLKERGHQILYHTKMTELLFDSVNGKKKIVGVRLHDGRELFSDHVILATGHSAGDVYKHLQEQEVAMQAKDFAVGVRMEHPRALIDGIQYGCFAGKELGAGRYRLSYHNKKTDRGTYSFCMCPGGYVLSSGTEVDRIVVNGMSNFSRSSAWSNAAIVVQVKAGIDFAIDDVLSGLTFQREIEKRAFDYSQARATGKEIPAQPMIDFLENRKSKSGSFKSSTPSKTVSANLHDLLPQFISEHLTQSFLNFEQKMGGLIDSRALLLAPETRTSSPITVMRDRDSFQSVNIEGLYPCGEGAGYAGGITSAAADGVAVTMKIIENL